MGLGSYRVAMDRVYQEISKLRAAGGPIHMIMIKARQRGDSVSQQRIDQFTQYYRDEICREIGNVLRKDPKVDIRAVLTHAIAYSFKSLDEAYLDWRSQPRNAKGRSIRVGSVGPAVVAVPLSRLEEDALPKRRIELE